MLWQICIITFGGDFTLFLEAKPGGENKTICGDALSLFLSKLLALKKSVQSHWSSRTGRLLLVQ